MRGIIVPLTALALTACPAAPEQNAAQAPDQGNGATNSAAEVAALPVGQRNAVLLRAIRDAGLPCQGVSRSAVAGTASKPTWRAECNDGTAHLVEVRPDGVAVVTSRTGTGADRP